MTYDVEGEFELGRVSYIQNDCMLAHIELRRDGRYATVTSQSALSLNRGDVVLIDVEGGVFHTAPSELWTGAAGVGVVRIKRDDLTLVDNGGRLVAIPTRPDVEYDANNTVEYEDKGGVSAVWSKTPVRPLDYSDSVSVGRFRRDRPPEAERLGFDRFGGSSLTVQRARELVMLPLREKDNLAAIGARAIQGVLFTGPPGTGKTHLAKIIADQSDATFYEISGPQIFSKWYGEGEELIRAIFEDARNQGRAIVFFDEIDSVAGRRDGGSHEASRRVVAQLLTSMDGFRRADGVVVIAATNRPDDIDPALRRPGRFDWEIEFPLPDVEARAEVLRVSGVGIQFRGEMPYEDVARRSAGWSAAELASVWSEASLLAVDESRAEIIRQDFEGAADRVADQHNRRSIVEAGEVDR